MEGSRAKRTRIVADYGENWEKTSLYKEFGSSSPCVRAKAEIFPRDAEKDEQEAIQGQWQQESSQKLCGHRLQLQNDEMWTLFVERWRLGRIQNYFKVAVSATEMGRCSQQIRQRKGQQFQGHEDLDCVVDPYTGWRFYRQSRGNVQTSASGSRSNLQAASSSSSTGTKPSGRQANGILSTLQVLTSGDFSHS